MLSKEELKQRIDLVDLIGRTVKLRKNGDHYVGLCPLHHDTNPSLTVYPQEQRWRCFGCSKHGDCFQWVMDNQKIDFKSALDQLQSEYGDGTMPTADRRRETTWDITDVDGNLLAKHVRIDLPGGRKTYEWWLPNGEKSKNGEIKPTVLPLYGIKHLFASSSPKTIIITEGEKAAEAIMAHGYAGLGTVTGAGGDKAPEESVFHPLIGFEAEVYLWPDNDPPGYAHMAKIAKHLLKMGIEPYLIKWEGAPPKGDAYDFLSSAGLRGSLTIEDLLANAQPWPMDTARAKTEIKDESVEESITLISGNTLLIKAENVRRERTGIHARITLLLDKVVLGWGVLNIERSEERGKLAKSAFDRFPEGVDNLCDLSTLKGHLDAFTASLWDNSVSQDIPKLATPAEDIAPLVFLAKPYVLKGGGTIMFAPPGAGKSYITLLMAVSVDAGISTLWPVNQAKVLFINLERSEESVTRRLTMVNKVLGLPATRPLLMLNRRGRALADVAESVKMAIKKYGVKVVFLDSISRFGTGDLNENVTANRTIDSLSSLCPTWFALGHTPRADDSHTYGSVHWDAGADLTVQLSSQLKDSALGVGLRVTKSNDAPRGQMQAYALVFSDDYGLTEARPARAHEFGELALSQKLSPTQEVINFLLDAGQATATEISDGLGRNRSNISSLLNDGDDFIKTRREGRNQFWGLKDKTL